MVSSSRIVTDTNPTTATDSQTEVSNRPVEIPDPAIFPASPSTTQTVDAPSQPAQPQRSICPKCDTRLVSGYDEPKCPSCGYADYSYTSEIGPREGRSLLGTATRFNIRYVGDFPDLVDTLAHIKLVRVRNRVLYEVDCPFSGCNYVMEQSSLSGRRHEIREQRYKCDYGHRVSLIPTKRNMLGWK